MTGPEEALVERGLELLRRSGDSERKREAMRAQLARLRRRLLLREARAVRPGAAAARPDRPAELEDEQK